MKEYFTCIGRRHGAPAIPVTRKEWEELRNAPWLKEMCKRILKGDESLKSKLPIWTPGCAEFKDNHRSLADALKPQRRLTLDFDEKGHSEEILKKSLELQKQGKWEVLLVEESVRKGTHVLITLPEGMTPQEAQQRFSKDVGFQADPALKDVASRCIYMVPAENTLYVSERLFSPQSFSPQSTRSSTEDLIKPADATNTPPRAGEVSEGRRGEVSSAQLHTPSASLVPLQEGQHNNPCQSVKSVVQGYPQNFKGIPYTSIIEKWFKDNGGEPQQGERNEKLFRLASQLRYITDNNEGHLLQVIPCYGLDEEEMKKLIHSACSAKFYGMPQALRKLLSELKGEDKKEEDANLTDDESTPPSMPKKLPPLIELLVSRTPDIYKAAVAHAVFPALGAHLWQTTFRYIDNVEHEATLMNVLMAGTGAGKNCITEPVNRILADIRRRDKENMLREKAWKKEMQSMGANKNKRQRPEGLVIQEIDPDMTNAAFVQRLADAEGRFLYTKMNEIDQFDALKTSANRKSQFQIMCLAFDPGNVYGQTRIGTGSVTERVCIRFNWNASTTIQKGQAYFRSVLTDGPISRINFCTIPEREIGAVIPVYGAYDDAFDRELAEYIDRLNEARGEIICPEAFELAKQLSEECAEFARLSQSRVYENLSFRANVIAYLKACVLYVAHGDVWDKTMEDFVRWSLQYDLWCKMEFFGEAIEMQTESVSGVKKRGPQNLLDLLPEVFTYEEAGQLRKRLEIRQGSLKMMLGNWKHRGYIEPYSEDEANRDSKNRRYCKTTKYLKEHPQI